MAWTAPKTWLAGSLVAAADMNQISDDLAFLKLLVDSDGKIPALNSTYLANLDGSVLTGILKLAAGNNFTAGVQNFNGGATTRVVLPCGPDRWAT